jgi:hypothetical protein
MENGVLCCGKAAGAWCWPATPSNAEVESKWSNSATSLRVFIECKGHIYVSTYCSFPNSRWYTRIRVYNTAGLYVAIVLMWRRDEGHFGETLLTRPIRRTKQNRSSLECGCTISNVPARNQLPCHWEYASDDRKSFVGVRETNTWLLPSSSCTYMARTIASVRRGYLISSQRHQNSSILRFMGYDAL